MEPHVRAHHEIAHDLRQQGMPVVRAKPIVCPLPEIRPRLRLHPQAPVAEGPASRLAMPRERRMHLRPSEHLANIRAHHGGKAYRAGTMLSPDSVGVSLWRYDSSSSGGFAAAIEWSRGEAGRARAVRPAPPVGGGRGPPPSD